MSIGMSFINWELSMGASIGLKSDDLVSTH